MESEKDKSGSYIFPHIRKDLSLRVRKTANAWWQDPLKVLALLQAFDNRCASINEACNAAGISRRQYKYFAQEHPIIYERRRAAKFIKREREIAQKHREISQRLLAGDGSVAKQYLAYEETGYDGRHGSVYSHLRRIHGLPAVKPPPKSEEQKLRDMAMEVEKTRIMFERHSRRRHYNDWLPNP